jgi:hypothetical protein
VKYDDKVNNIPLRYDTSSRRDYEDVARRLAESAYDDEVLTPEEIVAMEEGSADIEAGRVRSLRDIMMDLGDDTLTKS